jgi:hypothetical protein
VQRENLAGHAPTAASAQIKEEERLQKAIFEMEKISMAGKRKQWLE